MLINPAGVFLGFWLSKKSNPQNEISTFLYFLYENIQFYPLWYLKNVHFQQHMATNWECSRYNPSFPHKSLKLCK